MIDENKNPWTSLHCKTVYENPWIKVDEHQVLNPASRPGIYGVVHFKNLAIGILAVENDQLWLIGQYRFPLSAYSWEIPEGGGKLEVDPLLSAQRELLEEVGAKAEVWKEIGRFHLSNSVSDELAIVYLATNLSYQQAMPEETEELQMQLIPIETAYAWVKSGKITDAISVIAIQQLMLTRYENDHKANVPFADRS
jgi:8-oxo-dGTP pyrophosphatase MutT (NUDIX family)